MSIRLLCVHVRCIGMYYILVLSPFVFNQNFLFLSNADIFGVKCSALRCTPFASSSLPSAQRRRWRMRSGSLSITYGAQCSSREPGATPPTCCTTSSADPPPRQADVGLPALQRSCSHRIMTEITLHCLRMRVDTCILTALIFLVHTTTIWHNITNKLDIINYNVQVITVVISSLSRQVCK